MVRVLAKPSVIRSARERRGIGVRELARRAQVTPGAVSQWELSESQGTIRQSTLDRALRAMGTSLEEERPEPRPGVLERREDRVTLELHREVAKILIEHPSLVLEMAAANIRLLRTRVRGESALAWVNEWELLVNNGRLGPIIDVALGIDERSIDMRQTSPFGGVLTQQQRLDAITRAQ